MNATKILIAVGVIVLQACELYAPIDEQVLFNNPLDPNGTGYVDPKAIILSGPMDNMEVLEDVVQYTWSGNHGKSTFRYKLIDYSTDWSQWLDTTRVSFSGLVDADYTFLIQEKYPNNLEQPDTTVAHFVINAIEGPALLFNQTNMEVQNGSTLTLKVLANEFSDVMILFTTIQFNTEYLLLHSATKTEGAFTQNADAITFLSTNTADANAIGEIEINLGRFGGTPAGFTGNATLFELSFICQKAGTTNLVFKSQNQETIAKNSSNQTIEINNYIPITITIN